MLHHDELQAECRAKLALIIHAGHLNRCPTRGKAFGFIKTAMSNHVRSLVQKYAFTEKRTGVKPPPKQRYSSIRWNCIQAAKVVNLSLDDEDACAQLGGNDPAFGRMEFMEELSQLLTREEQTALSHLIRRERNESPQARLPLPEKKFRLLVESIRAKGRAVRDRAA
jgi:hypothetical protein